MNVEPLLRAVPDSALPLWRIRQLSDLYVDAMVRDDVGQIIFLSVFGRDGAIHQLFSAFHLPVSDGGIDKLTLDPATPACPSWTAGESGLVGDPKRFGKVTGKLPRGLFGNVGQAFVFDEGIVGPDPASGSGWVLSVGAQEDAHESRLWGLVKHLLPLPVLDHWQSVLLDSIAGQIQHMDRQTSPWPAIGRVRASRVGLDLVAIGDAVSELVRRGVLAREPSSSAVASAA